MARSSVYRWTDLRGRHDKHNFSPPLTNEARCRGITLSGKRCKLPGLGSGEFRYCEYHQRQKK